MIGRSGSAKAKIRCSVISTTNQVARIKLASTVGHFLRNLYFGTVYMAWPSCFLYFLSQGVRLDKQKTSTALCLFDCCQPGFVFCAVVSHHTSQWRCQHNTWVDRVGGGGGGRWRGADRGRETERGRKEIERGRETEREREGPETEKTQGRRERDRDRERQRQRDRQIQRQRLFIEGL